VRAAPNDSGARSDGCFITGAAENGKKADARGVYPNFFENNALRRSLLESAWVVTGEAECWSSARVSPCVSAFSVSMNPAAAALNDPNRHPPRVRFPSLPLAPTIRQRTRSGVVVRMLRGLAGECGRDLKSSR
jgi:hypothetical protein